MCTAAARPEPYARARGAAYYAARGFSQKGEYVIYYRDFFIFLVRLFGLSLSLRNKYRHIDHKNSAISIHVYLDEIVEMRYIHSNAISIVLLYNMS
jgi:hypothetical protein